MLGTARRKFVDAQKAQAQGKSGSADEAVKLIGKLYGAERELKDITDIVVRQKTRTEHSALVIMEILKWLDKQIPREPPKSKLGEALA